MKACQQTGMTLLELLIAMGLTSLLMLGLFHFASAAGSSNRLMENQAMLQDQLRVTRRVLARAVRQAGFNPNPWQTSQSINPLGEGTVNSHNAGSDRLVVKSWSDRNCFDNLNPVKNTEGDPAFHIRESAFDVSNDGHLTRDCRYGPALSDMTTQIRRQGLVPGIESFQLLFGEDTDANGNIDRWSLAQDWGEGNSVKGVRVGLLLASQDSVTDPVAHIYRVLDETKSTRADGKLRLNAEFVFALRGADR